MLLELTVRDLGVIEDLTLVFGPGMTALTGETGAGKTLVVEAIELLVGGRPDSVLVRPGSEEAWVEGRFVSAGGVDEVILARAVPAAGRSRAYIDGRMATASALAEAGAELVDLHGQHAHQSLLLASVQRAALDQFAGTDHGPFDRARAAIKSITAALEGLGGDVRTRVREADLLRFQLDELVAAGLDDPDEEDQLAELEAILAEAGAWREAAASAYEALQGDGSAGETIGRALTLIRPRGKSRDPFGEVASRIAAAGAEIADAASDLRSAGEAISDDPEQLAQVQQRRQVLRELRRKYGDTLADVIAFAGSARARLEELDSFEERAARLEADLASAQADADRAAQIVAAGRREAAAGLGTAVEVHLRDLALPRARFEVTVDGPAPADNVVFGFSANPGEPVLPLAKIASGGELARVMLAARLVLTAGPPTLVFDEVDAGIGGEAAVAVASALSRLGREPGRQVVVVTHLAQVAAFADSQIVVSKRDEGGRTVARAQPVESDERVRELGRMLSGRPDSASAREHAQELLDAAASTRRPEGRKAKGRSR